MTSRALNRSCVPGRDYATITDKITSDVLQPEDAAGVSGGVCRHLRPGHAAVSGRRATSFEGAWVSGGSRIPIAWGFAIVNFVWWIGIGHAGTLISAILLLLIQRWRNSINRFAEAMTLFAVGCARAFPLLHLGRPWVFYWILPLPGHDDALAAVQEPARVGRVRREHLPHDFVRLLVCRTYPRPRHHARQGKAEVGQDRLRRSCDGLERIRAALGAL